MSAYIALAALAIGGAIVGNFIGLPISVLTGPAIATALGCIAGLPLRFPMLLRHIVFLLAGITIGATVTQSSVAALAKWPLAFVLLGLAVVAMMIAGKWAIRSLTGVDRRTALLGATPGHLSFVIALGEELGLGTDKIALVQTIRLFALTLLVPLIASFAGIDTSQGLSRGADMALWQFGLCLILAGALTPLMQRIKAPAAILLAGMAAGASLRLTGMAEGAVTSWISQPVLVAIGALIGTRFAGLTLAQLRAGLGVGLATTGLSIGIAALAAWAATWITGMPLLHVLVAFAPGGLETMTVIGTAIGANPSFIAAAHVARLLLLSVLVPVMIARVQDPLPQPR